MLPDLSVLGWCLLFLGTGMLAGVAYLLLKPQDYDWGVLIGGAVLFKGATIVLGTVLGAFFIFLSFRVV